MTENGKEMIACCGLVCTECPGYIATRENDPEKIAATARAWSKEHGREVRPEDVWCDGCLVEGKKCAHCSECAVRACCIGRGLDNCALCSEFSSCDTIRSFLKIVPPARAVLENIRNS